ncbi:MAG: hypothetical protein KKG47_04095 [Proteobacteria bacterium]|nr:hypothetical protein [Pseudomonadota bacterium]MBU1738127.1 hypothetical protein [Pseudomonadota bacterium]
MKKALSFAVALGLVAGMASAAVAADNLTLTGEARWRGSYKNNHVDASDTGTDRRQVMDQRYRLNASIKVNDDVKIGSRIVLLNQEFGNDNTTDNQSKGTDNTYNTADDGHGTSSVDRAWMDIKTLGGTWSFGRMEASWGNKFMGWGSSVDRVKATYKAGDLTFAGYLQKDVEGDSATSNGDQDKDTWGALVVGKAGDTKWGVIANYVIDDRSAAKTSGEDTGYLVDAFFNAKAGAANILGEIFYSDGDLLDNSNKDAIIGGFVGASMAAGPATLKGIVAMWDGNEAGGSSTARDCDDDFAPSLLIGTCNETAIIDFGATTSASDPGDSTYLVAAGADMKINDKINVGGGIGYLQASEHGYVVDDSKNLIEVDVYMSYALAQNATYTLGIAYGDWDNASANDDALFVVGNRVNVTF